MTHICNLSTREAKTPRLFYGLHMHVYTHVCTHIYTCTPTQTKTTYTQNCNKIVASVRYEYTLYQLLCKHFEMLCLCVITLACIIHILTCS